MSKLTPKERYLQRVAAGQPHFTGLRIAKPLRQRLTEGHRCKRQLRIMLRKASVLVHCPACSAINAILPGDHFADCSTRILAAPLKTEFSTDPVESQAEAETSAIKEESHETQP